MTRISSFAFLFPLSLLVAPMQGQVDLSALHSIKEEALQHSEVMDHVFQLVDVHGPRLTGSPGFRAAGNWAVQRLQEWGLSNVHEEPWGPYGQGWSILRFSAHLVEPGYETLIGMPLTWTPSTDGPISGEPIIAPLLLSPKGGARNSDIDRFITKHRGKLEGKILLLSPPRPVEGLTESLFTRLSEADLDQISQAPDPDPGHQFRRPSRAERRQEKPPGKSPRKRSQNRVNRFLTEEKVALVIRAGWRGSGGTVFPPVMGSPDPEDRVPPPAIVLTPEHYNRLYRLVSAKVPTRIEVEVKTQFYRESSNSFNVIADLPGQDDSGEFVMIGAHLDSVGGALGATDNAAGCAVMMEVMRVLKTLDLPIRRTVRLALWGGEEEGLLGSRAYVAEHFADPETKTVREAHSTLSAYYNLDNGTGRIRGVYLQGNEMVRPIFASWLNAFSDMGAQTLSIRDTGGTDHLSFDAVGLPGFQFIQDPIEYQTRSHHSNMDGYDRIQAADLMQAVAVIATFVNETANRQDLLPRKPLPEEWNQAAQPDPTTSARRSGTPDVMPQSRPNSG